MKKPVRRALAELIAATPTDELLNIKAATLQDIELWGAAVMNTPSGAERWNGILKLCDTIKDSEPQAFEAAKEWIERRQKYGAAVAYFEPFGEWWRRHYNSNSINKAAWHTLIDTLERCEPILRLDAPQRVAIYTVLLLQVPTGYTPAEPQPADAAEHTQQQPRWLQTDRAKAIFEAMAEAGYIEQQGDGYTWLDIEEQGKKKQCAYFCGKCVEELQDGHHGWNDLKRVFGVSFNVQQSYLKNKDNEQDKIEQWRQQINGIFARNAKP